MATGQVQSPTELQPHQMQEMNSTGGVTVPVPPSGEADPEVAQNLELMDTV